MNRKKQIHNYNFVIICHFYTNLLSLNQTRQYNTNRTGVIMSQKKYTHFCQTVGATFLLWELMTSMQISPNQTFCEMIDGFNGPFSISDCTSKLLSVCNWDAKNAEEIKKLLCDWVMVSVAKFACTHKCLRSTFSLV